ncbi:hypothetical protein PED39_03550 [Methanomassiliicoccales archaeon LGM-RCC1]|nr:hypothetical protein PED39_03550 [Methanomassiliicoccales archaeon LGM-RCC1]
MAGSSWKTREEEVYKALCYLAEQSNNGVEVKKEDLYGVIRYSRQTKIALLKDLISEGYVEVTRVGAHNTQYLGLTDKGIDKIRLMSNPEIPVPLRRRRMPNGSTITLGYKAPRSRMSNRHAESGRADEITASSDARDSDQFYKQIQIMLDPAYLTLKKRIDTINSIMDEEVPDLDLINAALLSALKEVEKLRQNAIPDPDPVSNPGLSETKSQ